VIPEGRPPDPAPHPPSFTGGDLSVTGNGDLPTQRRVESILTPPSQGWLLKGDEGGAKFRGGVAENGDFRQAGRKSVRIASLFSLFYFAIFLDSTKRIFPDSGLP
jgi:hypothetical protein